MSLQVQVRGPDVSEDYQIPESGDPIIVGRGPSASIRLPAPSTMMSREHLSMSKSGDRVEVAVLSALIPVEIPSGSIGPGARATVAIGDRIRVGAFLLTIVSVGDEGRSRQRWLVPAQASTPPDPAINDGVPPNFPGTSPSTPALATPIESRSSSTSSELPSPSAAEAASKVSAFLNRASIPPGVSVGSGSGKVVGNLHVGVAGSSDSQPDQGNPSLSSSPLGPQIPTAAVAPNKPRLDPDVGENPESAEWMRQINEQLSQLDRKGKEPVHSPDRSGADALGKVDVTAKRELQGEGSVAAIEALAAGLQVEFPSHMESADWQRVGSLLRLLADGVHRLMVNRAEARRALGVDGKTIARLRRNNPYKVQHLGADEVIRKLLNLDDDGEGYIDGEMAIREALNDLITHQAAMVAASRDAMARVVHEFAPENLRKESSKVFGAPRLSVWGPRAAWSGYTELYEFKVRTVNDWVASLQGHFVRAYEKRDDELGRLDR